MTEMAAWTGLTLSRFYINIFESVHVIFHIYLGLFLSDIVYLTRIIST